MHDDIDWREAKAVYDRFGLSAFHLGSISTDVARVLLQVEAERTLHAAELAAVQAVQRKMFDERSRYITAAQRLYAALEVVALDLEGYRVLSTLPAAIPESSIKALQSHVQIALSRHVPAPIPLTHRGEQDSRLEAAHEGFLTAYRNVAEYYGRGERAHSNEEWALWSALWSAYGVYDCARAAQPESEVPDAS